METLNDVQEKMKDLEKEMAFFRKTIVGKDINYIPKTQKVFYFFSVLLLILIAIILSLSTRSIIKIETAMAPLILTVEGDEDNTQIITNYDQSKK